MTYHESVSGIFEDDGHLSEFNMIDLNKALQQSLERYNACFICFHDITFGVISQGGLYYIFDSHSKDCNGCQVQNGKSSMRCALIWQNVYRYCTLLAQSMNLS